ncbi:MAG: hypothetical protein SF123_05715, partial [Chloroflexota bacterium]|nr:hypothetical protein [Chloroflexota bacterium]
MVALLQTRTWRNLRAAARAYNLPFDNNDTRVQAGVRLRTWLLEHGHLQRAFRQLTDDELTALRDLQASGGQQRLTHFCQRYGIIRRYRPWRADSPRHPWKRPVSTAEKLWHLAMIEIERGASTVIRLPDEVAALLPPLPLPEPVQHPVDWRDGIESKSHSANFMRDLVAFVASFQSLRTPSRFGRWFSVQTLRAINQRLVLPDALHAIRSERHTHRLRWLHYVAHVAALLHDDTPTPAFSHWLASADPLAHVWSAIVDDLRHSSAHWLQFGFPVVSASALSAVLQLLDKLVSGASYRPRALWRTVRHRIDWRTFRWLLHGPLRWSGRVVLRDNIMILHAAALPASQPAHLEVYDQALIVQLPAFPHLQPLAHCWAWAHSDTPYTLRIDA